MQHIQDCLGTHLAYKLVRIAVVQILVVAAELFGDVPILFLAEQVSFANYSVFDTSCIIVSLGTEDSRLDYDIALVIDDAVQLLCRHPQQISYLVGQTAKVPDMCNGHDQLDVTTALTTHLLLRNLYATAVTYSSLVTDSLVLSAMTLIILGGTEDSLTEQSVTLWLVGTIVDGFGLQHLAM